MPSAGFQPREDDLLAAKRLHFRLSLKNRRVAIALLVMSAGGAIVGAGSAWEGDRAALVASGIVGFLAGALFFAFLLFISYLSLSRRTRRIYAQQKSLKEPIVVEWSDEGIVFTSSRGFGRYQWSDFIRIAQDRDMFVFLHNDELMNFLPKRALSPGQIESVAAQVTH